MPTGQRPFEPPPGDDWLTCIDAPLDGGLAASWAVRPDCGAVVCFVGTTRDHAGDRTGVHLLEYEAYESQVIPALEATATELRRRVPSVGRVALWHRVGALQLGDAAVVVAVSTPHRDEAFAATHWAIDDVKATAPIWKREHHDDGVDWGRCDHRDGHLPVGNAGTEGTDGRPSHLGQEAR